MTEQTASAADRIERMKIEVFLCKRIEDQRLAVRHLIRDPFKVL